MTIPESLDLLDRLSPEELTVFFYRYILGLSDTEIVDCRWRYKLTYLDCHRTINRIYEKRRKTNNHEEKICALQEIFGNRIEQGVFNGEKFTIV